MKTLILPVKREFFEAIRDGSKTHEYREVTDNWCRKLIDQHYDQVVISLGYPPKARDDLRLVRPWRAPAVETITHPFFNDGQPTKVFAIDVRVNDDGEKVYNVRVNDDGDLIYEIQNPT